MLCRRVLLHMQIIAELTWGDTPLRLRPASVSNRGSSQPLTSPPVANLFSLRLLITLCARLRRLYSHTTGLYRPSTYTNRTHKSGSGTKSCNC